MGFRTVFSCAAIKRSFCARVSCLIAHSRRMASSLVANRSW